MLRPLAAILIGWAVAGAVAPAASDAGNVAALNAQSILAASDAVRNPERPFGVTVTLTAYRDGKQTDANVLAAYSKLDPATGEFRTLVRYLEPRRDTGKLLLENGNEMWFYDPSSQASVRISPQERLLGQAANGDVVSVNLAHDYRAELATQESILDGDRHATDCDRLELSARSSAVTYHRIAMWIEKKTSRPIKAMFYAESGQLLKTAYYRHFQAELGVQRPTEVVIIDGLMPTWVTVLRYSDYAWRDVPDSWFQRDYLPRFRPE